MNAALGESKDRYHIKAVYEGHTADVRVVTSAHVPEGAFITGSRDSLVKLWVPVNELGYKDEHIFMGATNFIASLCALPPSEQYPNGLILAGSNDCSIYGFSIGNKNPIMRLLGHSHVVCSLSSGYGLFISGSWDKTARIWNGQQCTAVLEGHEQAVWAVAVYPLQNMIITGSADRTIRIWRHGVCENVLYGHEDCVRNIVLTRNLNFLSCSNDGTVRLWNIQGQCLNVYYCHDNYVYSVTLLNNEADFATCSEDQSVKVWINGKCVQTIEIPSKTLWNVTCLKNDDLIVGSSDGSVYVLGKGKAYCKLSTPTATPSSSQSIQIAKKGVNGDVDSHKKIEIDTLPSKKEKDFELYLELNGSIQNIAFNRDENPYDIAVKFATEQNLDISSVPELIELIVLNSDLKKPMQQFGQYEMESYYIYGNANVKGLKAKLLEFADCVPESKQLAPKEIEKLIELTNFPEVVSDSQLESLELAIFWNDEYLYPVLDLLRLAVRCEEVCARMCNENSMNHLLKIFVKSEKSINCVLVIKIFCNIFGFKDGEHIMLKFQKRILTNVMEAMKRDERVHKSCLSLFLNYAVASHKGLDVDIDLFCSSLVDVLKEVKDADCFYKGFLSIATISIAHYSALLEFHSLNLFQILNYSRKYVESSSAMELLKILNEYFQP